MNSNSIKILVIDDEEDLCEILQFNLESQGYEVSTAYSAEDALELKLEKYDLILLDVMMEGMSGFKLADKIRKDLKLSIPIIFLTARSAENDLLTGFSLGGDDYISKPFSINEVSARVKAVLKRNPANPEGENEIIDIDDIIINMDNKTVIAGDTIIDLPKKEFEILSLLMKKPGRIYSRDDIMNRIWPDEVIVNERTVDVNITRLRKKMGPFGARILNKPGYGYFYQPNND